MYNPIIPEMIATILEVGERWYEDPAIKDAYLETMYREQLRPRLVAQFGDHFVAQYVSNTPQALHRVLNFLDFLASIDGCDCEMCQGDPDDE